MAGRLGMSPETLRQWIRQAEIDDGDRGRVTTGAARQIREWKRKLRNRGVPTHNQGCTNPGRFIASDRRAVGLAWPVMAMGSPVACLPIATLRAADQRPMAEPASR